MAWNFSKSGSCFSSHLLLKFYSWQWLSFTLHAWRDDDAITFSNCFCLWSVAAVKRRSQVWIYCNVFVCLADPLSVAFWMEYMFYAGCSSRLAHLFVYVERHWQRATSVVAANTHPQTSSHTHWVSVGVLLFSGCCIYNSWFSDFTALLEFHCVFLNKVAL